MRGRTHLLTVSQRHEVGRGVLQHVGSQQVVEGGRVEHLQDGRLDALPDVARQAHRLARAGTRQVVFGGALDGRHLALEDAIHVADGDVAGRRGEAVAAAHAAHAFDQARPA